MSSYMLKWIAIICMLIDHIGAILFPEFIFLRIIGRIAFPIFCFLLVEGYFHTSSYANYLLRMIIFALISEIPFDLSLHGAWINPNRQNVFFTLVIALLMLRICDILANRHLLFTIPAVLACGILAWLLRTDYSFWGILFVYIFFFFRRLGRRDFALSGFWIINTLFAYTHHQDVQYFAILCTIPLYLYNGKLGSKRLQYLFYAFYPTHLFLLFLLKKILILT